MTLHSGAFAFPGRWVGGLAAVLGPLLVRTGMLMRIVTYSYVLMSVFAGLAVFWAALVLGRLIPPVARLIVGGLLFTVIPVTFAKDADILSIDLAPRSCGAASTC